MVKTKPTMGAIIRDLRQQRGLSLGALVTKICMQLPEPLWISWETLRRIEDGRIPEAKCDPLIVFALADVFGVKVSQISQTAADQLDVVRDLVTRSSSCMPVLAGKAA